jgi:hypothetical protein
MNQFNIKKKGCVLNVEFITKIVSIKTNYLLSNTVYLGQVS